jgi:hypothetical protein
MRHGFGGQVAQRFAADRHSVLLVGQVVRGVSPTVISSAVATFNAGHHGIRATWVNDFVAGNDPSAPSGCRCR